MARFSVKDQRRHSEFIGVYVCELRKRLKAEKFIGVKYFGSLMFHGQTYKSKYFETPREAALWYDKKRIELGLEPVNIFKKKAA